MRKLLPPRSFSRHGLLRSVSLCVCAGGLAVPVDAEPGNVLILLADDIGTDKMSVYGSVRVRRPLRTWTRVLTDARVHPDRTPRASLPGSIPLLSHDYRRHDHDRNH